MKCFEQISVKLKKPTWDKYEKQWMTHVPVPCGKCPACIQRKISEWTFRLEDERLNSAVTYFVTLTYDNQHVPINKYGKMTLLKSDIQDFMKALRHSRERTNEEEYALYEKHYYKTDIKKHKLKMYCVGEYGSMNKRPHYHMIIYNGSKWDISELWKNGTVDIQIPRSAAAMGYTIKYLQKRLYGTTPGNVTKEFSLMSKGIGINFGKKMQKWYKDNIDILYTKSESGIEAPMSKYYRNMLFTEDQKEQQRPIIKNALEEEEKKSIERLGEEKHHTRQHSKKQSFINKFKKNVKKRKDL